MKMLATPFPSPASSQHASQIHRKKSFHSSSSASLKGKKDERLASLYREFSRPVTSISYSSSNPLQELFPDQQQGDYLFLASDKAGLVSLRDGQTHQQLAILAGHRGCVWASKLSANGTLAATGGADGKVLLYNLVNSFYASQLEPRSSNLSSITSTQQNQPNVPTIQSAHALNNTMPVRHVSISPNNRYIITAGASRSIHIYDSSSSSPSTPIRSLEGSTKEVKTVLFSDERGIVWSGDDKQMRVWDLRIGEQVNARVFDAEISCLDQTPDGRYIVACAGEKVYFWDAQRPSLHHSIHVQSTITSIAFLPCSEYFTIGVNDQNAPYAYTYSSDTGHEVAVWKGHHGPVLGVAYSPNTEHMATSSEDGTVRIWKTGF